MLESGKKPIGFKDLIIDKQPKNNGQAKLENKGKKKITKFRF